MACEHSRENRVSRYVEVFIVMLTYLSNSAHYKEVLSRVLHVKESLWIETADIKDMYVT